METLILMAIIFFVVDRFAKGAKKKEANNKRGQQTAQRPNDRQQQAIEEQRRRRAAYEEMLRQQEEEHNKKQMQRMFGDIENTKKAKAEAEAAAAKAEEEAYEPHHIDEEEEQRCIDAEALKRARRVSQKELKRELLQRFGGLEERQSIKPRPQSLSQAQKQLHMPVAAVQTMQEAQESSRPRPRLLSEQDITPDDLGVQSLGMRSNSWAQGIVLAEILGPPRAKKRQIR